MTFECGLLPFGDVTAGWKGVKQKMTGDFTTMKLLTCATLFLLFALHSAAQELPKTDKIFLTGIAAVRAEDVFSTRWSLAHGGHEFLLPRAAADNSAGLTAIEGAGTFLQFEASKWAIRHNMRWLATTSEVVHFGSVGYFANRNWFVGHKIGRTIPMR